MSTGLEKFKKKEKVTIFEDAIVKIPPIYYWEDVDFGISTKMTMAFKWKGKLYGLSYLISDNVDILRRKLFGCVKESLDVLVHYGSKVLDSKRNIVPNLVQDAEAIRFKYDNNWKNKVMAFNKLVRIMPITKKKAIKLGLL